MNSILTVVFAMKQALTLIFGKALFFSKTVFGDDLPELRLTSKTSTLQQLLELCNIHEQLNNATSPVNDHSPGLKIVNLMDNGLHQHQIMFLEQHA